MEPERDPRQLRPLHRRGGGRRRAASSACCQALPLIVGVARRRPPRPGRSGRRATDGGGRTERDLPLWLVGARLARRWSPRSPSSHLIPTDVAGRVVGAVMIVALRLPVRHRRVAAHRRDRLVVEPDLGDDGRHAAADLPDLRPARLGRARVPPGRALDRRRSSASRRRTAARPRRTSRRATSSAPRPGRSRSRSWSAR